MKHEAKPILKMVTAPHVWHCRCGKVILGGEKCAKMGKVIICTKCLEAERESNKGNMS